MAKRATPGNRVTAYQAVWFEPSKPSLDSVGLALRLEDGSEVSLSMQLPRLQMVLQMLRAFRTVVYDPAVPALVFGPSQPGRET